MTEPSLTINLALETIKSISVPFNSTTTAEDVCITICKQLNIGTLARHLFALRVTGKQTFLSPSEFVFRDNLILDFRIRFKVDPLKRLDKIDINAYNYYFQQARIDVLENKVPGLSYDKYKKELVGLGITDMYRVILEKGISRDIVANDYKKYLHKDVVKKHALFIKKPIIEHLRKLEERAGEINVLFVKAQYMTQLDIIAPDYLFESYKAVTDLDGQHPYSITVQVAPFDKVEPGLKYCLESKKNQWTLICSIEDLGFISIRNDGAIEISRKNGIPFYLKFQSMEKMYSFISLVDGYYRLTCKWTFNVCREVSTPSLKKLHVMKCHGPVGGEFSYAKLESKRSNRVGCFIIRESETNYNIYYIDVCMKDSLKPKTFKLEKIKEEGYIFNDDPTKYKNIHQLMHAYNDQNGTVYLQECIPPSEYDISPLLLCRSESVVGDALTDSSSLNVLIPQGPVCINYKDLQVYKGQGKEGHRGITLIYRGMWKIARGKKMEVALKLLKQQSLEKYLKDYLNLIGQWAFLKSSAVVRFFGVALAVNNISLVTEYFKLGPLDQYLRDNRSRIQKVDLIEAASNLASAVWHLKENDIVHGKIRCRKLMVNCHEENTFTVKLADPGLHTNYETSDVHWIPIECYTTLDYAKRSTAADIWALATTFYEIFTYGKVMPVTDHVQTMRWYMSGKRLPQPQGCDDEIYTLMMECWHSDPHRRKQPQEVSRDINQLLYQVYNSRKRHPYDTIRNTTSNTRSTYSLSSNTTDTTEINYDELISANDPEVSSNRSESSFSNASSQHWLLSSQDLVNFDPDLGDSKDFSKLFSNSNFTISTSVDSLNSMEGIFELDDECSVVLQGRIGMGFYGDVYRGTLEYFNNPDIEPRVVAVKKLKSSAMSSSCLADFEREIKIMKGLQHDNIVEILGVLRNPEILLVMEFVQHGSLQSYLKINKETLQIPQLLKYASNIAEGMKYLGFRSIVHRDLAARNILVVDDNKVKISDFGLAQFTGTSDYYILKSPNRELPIKWYAPESLAEGKFSVKSDVWSYGVTMYEMFNYGEEPPTMVNIDKVLEGQEQQVLLSAIMSGARFPCPPNCPQAIYTRLIYPCWQADPHYRPSFEQLIKEINDLTTQY
ncbi:tyrosine-protein kinase JAK2 isoform X2 [Sitophilus oryzae]|uniref:non-specific protein-tyrosine kinase n=1 Tax=Sitophilus oryzae TaxID=7048 RepID=A0A6J2X1E7_SITOR|nr:tyrosine-protein kinase JAK2 isoform X2 [Sitophilus oryzae]